MNIKALITRPLFAALVFSTFLMSCSEESGDSKPSIDAPQGKIVATIGEHSFEATGGAQISNNEIIVGGNSGNETISIFITKAAKVGSYPFKGALIGTTPEAELNYSPDLETLYSSVYAPDGEKVGTVTITDIDEDDKTVSGTFKCTVVTDAGETLEIASGSFNKIPYETAPSSVVSAKIDGKAFTSTVAIGQNGMGMIVINGQTLNGSKIITISFDEDIAAGTYDIGELGDDVYATYTVDGQYYVSLEGSITISKHDTSKNRVEGTFSFDAGDFFEEEEGVIKFTEGSFAITYH